MVATQPHNRIAAHFETPEPELPKSARARAKIWSDTVFQAVLALKKQLRNSDANVAMAAAETILELERTRMRHAKMLAGSEEVSEAQEEFEAEQNRAGERYIAQRRADEAAAEEKAAAEAKRPSPTSSSPKAPTLADHAREARKVFEKTAGPMSEEESLQFTAGFLKRLGRDAHDVSKGEFVDILREMATAIEAGGSINR